MSPASGGSDDQAPDQRPDGRVSLLGGNPAGDRPQRSQEASLRSDHSRHHELAAPSEDFDESRAQIVCAEIVRDSLSDLAPALLMLPKEETRRLRILLAWARTLFDFTADGTLEGERLSHLNRWQFGTEQSLDGDPPGRRRGGRATWSIPRPY